jgi:predicted nucleic acid-binding protein
MFLVDTDVISEARKGLAANAGVREFFAGAARRGDPLYISAVTLGEIRQGVERIRHRGDHVQARRLERWLDGIGARFADSILPLDGETAQVWGRLRVPNAENPLDKQIAATALIHDLVIVTGNTRHFATTGARLENPFSRAGQD